MQHFLSKSLPILAFFCVLYVLYIIYRIEIYQWFCHRENNSASCYLVGTLKNDYGSHIEAMDYFERSCELDYGLGCYEIAVRSEESDPKRALELYHKACDNELQRGCHAFERMKGIKDRD